MTWRQYLARGCIVVLCGIIAALMGYIIGLQITNISFVKNAIQPMSDQERLHAQYDPARDPFQIAQARADKPVDRTTQYLSGEAREYCLGRGYDYEQLIEQRQWDECLVEYWTPKRLRQQPDVWLDTQPHQLPPLYEDEVWQMVALDDPTRTDEVTAGIDYERVAPVIEYPFSLHIQHPLGSFPVWAGFEDFCTEQGYTAAELAEDTTACQHDWFTVERVEERDLPVPHEGFPWWSDADRERYGLQQ